MHQTTLLAILQQSEYDLHDFRRWYRDHHTDSLSLEPDKWTAKLKLIKLVMSALFWLPELPRTMWATRIVAPIDHLIRNGYYLAASIKLWILRQKGLKVIAIAGSYGKTSTKKIMEHLLSGQQKILVTPKSINTLLGIAQVILDDLHSSHQLFVVEFGEYNAHDVAQLTNFTKPDLAVLTPIGRQHLERFGNLTNIIATFKPLVSFFAQQPTQLLMAANNASYFPQIKSAYYGSASDESDGVSNQNATATISQARVSRRGTEFELKLQNSSQPQPHQVFMPLYGEHQAINTAASFWAADKLGLDLTQVVKQAASLPYLDRRHQPHFGERDILVLDNSYNTNADSVTASLALLQQLDASRRIIITAGFVELGEASEEIHHQFGKQLAAAVDYVGLVDTPWATTIINGFVKAGGKREHIVVGKDFDDALAKLSGMIIPHTIILFEGGYREMYT